MISKKISRAPANDNYRALALYVADAKTGQTAGEKTLFAWSEGCEIEEYYGAMIEVEATQAMNNRTRSAKTYHLMVSFRPEDESKLTSEVFHGIEKQIAKALGYEHHQRHCGVHKNTSNMHMHIAYNMIHPQTFTRHAPYYDYHKLSKVCRELEAKYGLKIDKGIDDSKAKNETKTNVKAQTIEAHTGQQSLFGYVTEQKPKIMEALGKSSTWGEFHESILKLGLEIKPHGNGLTFKDRYGKHQVKASDIDRSLSKSKLEQKLGAFMEASKEITPSIKAEKSYTAAPLHLGSERDNLYEQFKLEMEQRKAALAEVKQEENLSFNSNRSKWAEKLKLIDRYPMLPQDKQQLLHDIKMKEQADLDSSRQTLNEKRKAIREAVPYTSWTKCLQHKAAQGNEVALAILRSKKVEIQPEKPTENTFEIHQKKTAEITQKSNIRQKEIHDTHGISSKHKKALLSVTKMHELLKKESLSDKNCTKMEQIQHKIDAKGTVIFTLKTGGTIRDTGTEIHFSPHDQNAQVLAQNFAALKWGRQVSIQENTLKLASFQEKKLQLIR